MKNLKEQEQERYWATQRKYRYVNEYGEVKYFPVFKQLISTSVYYVNSDIYAVKEANLKNRINRLLYDNFKYLYPKEFNKIIDVIIGFAQGKFKIEVTVHHLVSGNIRANLEDENNTEPIRELLQNFLYVIDMAVLDYVDMQEQILSEKELVADTKDYCKRFKNIQAAVDYFKTSHPNANVRREIADGLFGSKEKKFGYKWYLAEDFDIEF